MLVLVSGIKFFFIDLVTDLVRWPIWWYSHGLLLVAKFAQRSVQNYWRMLAVGVWVKNIFVPMYGTRDWQSRLISFLVRGVQIIARSFIWFIWLIIITLGLVLYLIAPPLIVVGFINQIIGLLIK